MSVLFNIFLYNTLQKLVYYNIILDVSYTYITMLRIHKTQTINNTKLLFN